MRAASAFFPNMDTCWVVLNLNLIYPVWFWVLTGSDGFCLLYFLVPCPGSVKRNQWWFSWTATEVKRNLLLCQRLKRNTNLTSLDSDIGGKRQSGNRHTPCSHLRGCPLFFSLCTKCRCCCVSTWDQQANVFFLSSVHVTRMNTRIEYEKYLYLNIFGIFY